MAVYDVILFGATGFTGGLMLKYLASKTSVKYAICGRNRGKMEQAVAELSPKPEILVLDVVSASLTEVKEVVKQTKCVCTSVGPFQEYGEALVQACAELGVDYTDTSGESTFMRQMIEKYDAVARQSGARIAVHCGQDCVPWDLMVWKLWQLNGSDLIGVKLLGEMRGVPSGGTLSTAMLSMRTKPSKGTLGFDPLYLADGKKSEFLTQVDLPKGSRYYEEAGQKGGPWIMGPVMANAVRRTNAVLKMVPDLKYHEAMLESSDFGLSTLSTMAMGIAVYLPFTQSLWYKMGVLPEPGSGPSAEEMEKGFLTLTGYAETKNKEAKMKAVMKFYTDPGYKDTARMCVEAALALVELPKSQKAGGVYSPAAACGEGLFDRLLATGTTWEVIKL